MSHLARYLKQDATYWGPASTDPFGKTTFNAPIPLKVRWERKNEQGINAKGREITSQAVVFVDDSVDVEFDGFLYEGVSSVSDPSDLDGAYQIQNVERIPSIRNLTALKMVVL